MVQHLVLLEEVQGAGNPLPSLLPFLAPLVRIGVLMQAQSASTSPWASKSLILYCDQAPAGSTLNSGIGIGIEFKPGSRD